MGPFAVIQLEEAVKQVLHSWREMRNGTFTIFFIAVTGDEILLVLPLPGIPFGRHEVEKNSKTERVAFRGVSMVFKGFRGHVERTSYEVSLLDGLGVITNEGESEVTELENTVLYENIGWFYVSMNDVEASQVLTGNADFVSSLTPIKVWVFLEEMLEVSPLTIFSDDVTVVDCPVEVLEGQGVGVVDRF